MTTDPVNMGKNALIGGLNPADRNLISGNSAGNGTGGYPGTGWVLQGNYVGVGANGLTPIPNSMIGGSGAFSVDDCSDVLIGGNQPGATNVISGNLSHGLAPFNSPRTIIRGNLIGTDWTGKIAVPNESGIVIGDNQTDSIIGGETDADRNIISGNQLVGIASGGTGGLRIEGNYVGLDIDGKTAIPNNIGVLLGDNTMLGGSENARNVISGNTVFNVSVQGILAPSIGGEISGNYIGTNANGDIDPAITNVQGEGIRVSANTSQVVIGGTAGNRIAGNRGSGVAVRSFTVTTYSLTTTPSKISVIGNQIYGNTTGGPIPSADGLGIDIYTATIADIFSQPTFADYQAESYTQLGPTPNDPTDTDTGPNNYINFPVINSVDQNNLNLSVNFNLDALDSPTNQYRVEFFANDVADPSGYGEGQTYLGYTTVSPGNNQIANLSLPAGTNLTGKVLSATTTAIDNTTTSGFGSTSEFSLASSITISSLPTNNNTDNSNTNTTNNQNQTKDNLANTGDNKTLPLIILSGVMIVVTIALIGAKTISRKIKQGKYRTVRQ